MFLPPICAVAKWDKKRQNDIAIIFFKMMVQNKARFSDIQTPNS
jgi:hypothetical protein